MLISRGLDNAGKTTIIHKLTNETTDDVSPTMGFSILSMDYQKNEKFICCYLQFSSEHLGHWWSGIYSQILEQLLRRGGHFLQTPNPRPMLLCGSSTVETRIEWICASSSSKKCSLKRQERKERYHLQKLIGAAVLILCNKNDLNGALSPEEITQVDLPCTSQRQYLDIKGPEFESRFWAVYSCSAITGDGLKEAFDWLVEHTYTGMEYAGRAEGQMTLLWIPFLL